MSKIPYVGLAAMASIAIALTAMGSGSVQAQAQSQTIIYKSVPSAAELSHELFGTPLPEPQPVLRTRGMRPLGETESQPVLTDVEVHWAANATNDDEGEPLKKYAFNIQFAFDSSTILPQSIPYIDRLGEVLKANASSDAPISIVGHTDASGPSDYNWVLSVARAEAVRNYLIYQWNVHPDRLLVDGRGEAELLTSLSPTDATHRRVEFWLADLS